MESVKFMRCNVCGNLVGMIHASGAIPVCCGQPMVELSPNSTDAATEKHVPVIEKTAPGMVTVKVGSAPHPMLVEHSIQWIALRQGSRMQRVALNPGDAPEATFALNGNDPVEAYAYCNLHGLWNAAANMN
jgi:superoxide reductase